MQWRCSIPKVTTNLKPTDRASGPEVWLYGIPPLPSALTPRVVRSMLTELLSRHCPESICIVSCKCIG